MKLMQSLFGQRPEKGEDIVYELRLSSAELSAGVERRLTLSREGGCADCHGRGRRTRTRCATCAGTGRTPETGAVSFSLGSDFLQQAPQTAGAPAFTLRMGGEGHAGQNGGSPDDLYVVLHVING